MNYFKNTDIAIITTEPVEKTFGNQDAYLYGTIELIKDDNHKRKRIYKIKTDLAYYVDINIPRFDENGDAILDENDNQIIDVKEKLTWLEQRQKWYRLEVSYEEIDAFAQSIENTIPSGLSKTEKEIFQLNTIFLLQRQQKAPWGIAPEKWKIATEQDLLKDKA